MPVLAGAADTDRPAVLGGIGHHDDLGAARHAPSFAEDVEFDLAEATGEGDLLGRCELLVAKEDHTMLIEGPIDRGERRIIEGLGQIDAANLGAERGARRDDLDGHGRSLQLVTPRAPKSETGKIGQEPTRVCRSAHPRERFDLPQRRLMHRTTMRGAVPL